MSIREALRELELWGVGANFSLTGYQDSATKELSIIKDWKELVNQVRRTCLCWCTRSEAVATRTYNWNTAVSMFSVCIIMLVC